MKRNDIGLSLMSRYGLTIDSIRYSETYSEGGNDEICEKAIEVLLNRMKNNDLEREFDGEEREALEKCFSLIEMENE